MKYQLKYTKESRSKNIFPKYPEKKLRKYNEIRKELFLMQSLLYKFKL